MAALLGALSVALGAFAAHSLKQKLAPDALNVFETAVRYQFYHTFALLMVGVIFKELTGNWAKRSGLFFIAGIVLFSGSLYALTATRLVSAEGFNWLGAITPFGGLCFIAGWISLFIACGKKAL